MKSLPCDTYTVVLMGGEVCRMRMPQIMGGPLEVAERRPHTLFFLHVKKDHKVTAYRAGESVLIEGPAVVLVHNGEVYLVPEEPTNDARAQQMFREFGPSTVAKPWR